MGYLPPYYYFIVISFLVSISVFFNNSNQERFLKLFPPFLFATLLAEWWGAYRWYQGKTNIGIYNFFTTFEFCFYIFFISLIVTNKQLKKIALTSIVLYALIAVTNILFIQVKTFHTVTYSLGCLVVVAFCVYYFLELFRQPKSIKLKNNPTFWICSGLLFFYCCGFPLYGLINLWSDISPLILQNFGSIFTILNVFLYSLFTIAFLCRTRIPKYTSSSSSV